MTATVQIVEGVANVEHVEDVKEDAENGRLDGLDDESNANFVEVEDADVLQTRSFAVESAVGRENDHFVAAEFFAVAIGVGAVVAGDVIGFVDVDLV